MSHRLPTIVNPATSIFKCRLVVYSSSRQLGCRQLTRCYSSTPHDPLTSSPAVASSSTSSSRQHPFFSRLPFRFETGIALFAKRQPRPFPPPFMSPPSVSFSDPLSTHHKSRDRRAFVDGELIRGYTNGDDAVYESDYFICANDGVGAWAARPRGHAGYVREAPLILISPRTNYGTVCGRD